jgi:hypothetical protein
MEQSHGWALPAGVPHGAHVIGSPLDFATESPMLFAAAVLFVACIIVAVALVVTLAKS